MVQTYKGTVAVYLILSAKFVGSQPICILGEDTCTCHEIALDLCVRMDICCRHV